MANFLLWSCMLSFSYTSKCQLFNHYIVPGITWLFCLIAGLQTTSVEQGIYFWVQFWDRRELKRHRDLQVYWFKANTGVYNSTVYSACRKSFDMPMCTSMVQAALLLPWSVPYRSHCFSAFLLLWLKQEYYHILSTKESCRHYQSCSNTPNEIEKHHVNKKLY